MVYEFATSVPVRFRPRLSPLAYVGLLERDRLPSSSRRRGLIVMMKRSFLQRPLLAQNGRSKLGRGLSANAESGQVGGLQHHHWRA
jgi:hypothetical protein